MAEAKIDEMNPDEDEEVKKMQIPLPWYMVNGDGSSMKSWDFFVTLVTIYSMFLTPFIMVFHEVYMNYNEETDKYETVTSKQGLLKTLEVLVDIVWLVNIALNFVKRTRTRKDLKTIIVSYIKGSFIFDIIGTLPCFLSGEAFEIYWLKLFRCIVHMFWLT